MASIIGSMVINGSLGVLKMGCSAYDRTSSTDSTIQSESLFLLHARNGDGLYHLDAMRLLGTARYGGNREIQMQVGDL
jgi:hypothetical protein